MRWISHATKGSPVYSCGHKQLGVWLTTRHCASKPQAPTQGFLHLLFIQAIWFGHSLLLVHSGRQFGGVPINSEAHEQEGELCIDLHIELGPHGEGTHGFVCGGVSKAVKKY